MKFFFIFTYLAIFFFDSFHNGKSYAQSTNPEVLSKEIRSLQEDKSYKSNIKYLDFTNQLAFYYANNFPDSALKILNKHAELCAHNKYYRGEVDAIKISGTAYQMKGNFNKAMENFELAISKAKKYDYEEAIPLIQNNLGVVFLNLGNYTKSLQYFYLALKEAEASKNKVLAGEIWNNIGIVHFFQGNYDKSLEDYKKLLKISIEENNSKGIIYANNNIGEIFLEKNNLEGALESFKTANKFAEKDKNISLQISSTKNLGDVYLKLNEIDKSIIYYGEAYKLSKQIGNKPSTCKALIGLSKAYNINNKFDVALVKLDEAIQLADQMKHRQLLRDTYEIKSKIYENKGESNLALQSFKLFKNYSDSLKNIESEKASELLKSNYEFSIKELDYQKNEIKQRWIIFSIFAALISVLIIAFIINKNRKIAKKSNKLLKEKNDDIEIQKSFLEKTLQQLKSTQAKLIQSEKLASLGELTAGIAHEIQNPLNFVNNFSEVSVELLEELKAERQKLEGKRDLAFEEELLSDLSQNQEKINHHGKRASSIVKAMLEHSRSTTGEKEPTDINSLADEFLRLSYHGFRAQDKTFNADFKVELDPNLPLVLAVSQDLGRVFLNLINNAFYACNERAKFNLQKGDAESYKPLVIVSTHQIDNNIEISVKDNGLGILPENLEKIFQPFFTTKPAGKGIGLGLSLSYDIVVKGHKGMIEVNSVENIGTTFTVKVPIS